jgi:hypothetical protein
VLREMMVERQQELNFQGNLQQVATKYGELLPHMKRLAVIALVLPVSTAGKYICRHVV